MEQIEVSYHTWQMEPVTVTPEDVVFVTIDVVERNRADRVCYVEAYMSCKWLEKYPMLCESRHTKCLLFPVPYEFFPKSTEMILVHNVTRKRYRILVNYSVLAGEEGINIEYEPCYDSQCPWHAGLEPMTITIEEMEQ